MSQYFIEDIKPFLSKEIIEFNKSIKSIKNKDDIEKVKQRYLEKKSKELFKKEYQQTAKELNLTKMFEYLSSKASDSNRKISMYELINNLIYKNEEIDLSEISNPSLIEKTLEEIKRFKQLYKNKPQGSEREQFIAKIKNNFDYLNRNDSLKIKKPKSLYYATSRSTKVFLDSIKKIKEFTDEKNLKKRLNQSQKGSFYALKNLFKHSTFFKVMGIFSKQTPSTNKLLEEILLVKSSYPDFELKNIKKIRQLAYNVLSKENYIREEYSEEEMNNKIKVFLTSIEKIFTYSNMFYSKESFLLIKEHTNINIMGIFDKMIKDVKETSRDNIKYISYSSLIDDSKTPNYKHLKNLINDSYDTYFKKLKQIDKSEKDQLWYEKRIENYQNSPAKSSESIQYLIKINKKHLNKEKMRLGELKNTIKNIKKDFFSKDIERIKFTEFIFELIENNFDDVFLEYKKPEQQNIFIKLIQCGNIQQLMDNKFGKIMIDNHIQKLVKKFDSILFNNNFKKYKSDANLHPEDYNIDYMEESILKYKLTSLQYEKIKDLKNNIVNILTELNNLSSIFKNPELKNQLLEIIEQKQEEVKEEHNSKLSKGNENDYFYRAVSFQLKETKKIIENHDFQKLDKDSFINSIKDIEIKIDFNF